MSSDSTSGDDLEELDGIGPAKADDLKSSGFQTYKELSRSDPETVVEETSLGESAAKDAVRGSREMSGGGFESAGEIREERKDMSKLKVHAENLDDVLGGGFEPGSINEFFGQNSSGKSQVVHQMAVNVQLPEEHGGFGGKAMFIDAEDTFRPERIDEMVEGLTDEQKQALMDQREIEGTPDDEWAMEELKASVADWIEVGKAFNSNHQMELAEKAKEITSESTFSDQEIKLIIVDSLTALFRAEYVGRGELAERQQKLNQHIKELREIARDYNATIIYTNQVSANPDYFGDPTQAIGGNILGHNSTYRIYIKSKKADRRAFRVVDAPNLPEREALGEIQDGGIFDPD